MTAPIPVPVGEHAYEVHVGTGLLSRLDELGALPDGAASAAVVTTGSVEARYAAPVRTALERAGAEPHVLTVPEGEAAKSLETLTGLYHRFAAIPLRRQDVVVALGGGVVGDLAGFAAATWHRGVAVLQVPTTLLAQVDASIGGKTGVNLPEGKNLVGAFHQPSAVVADISTLASLPARERRAGLGEVVKYGFIADPGLLDLLEQQADAVLSGDEDLLTEIVRRSVAVKARTVAADEREGGERALLNYGHTVGHAIEAVTGYDTYLHGEAVALGMVAAARLGEGLGVTEAGFAERTVDLLVRLGLPAGGLRLDPAVVWEHITRDKKVRRTVRFVLCERAGSALLHDDPPRSAVEAAITSLA